MSLFDVYIFIIILNYSIKIAHPPVQNEVFEHVARVITDKIGVQIQQTMQFYDCYHLRNSKDIIEAILWKLRTDAPWRDIPDDFFPWKTAYNCFNRWARRGLWENFLNYEAYLIQNGSSLTEATFARINMQVELGVVKLEQLAHQEAKLLQRFTLP